MRIGRYLQGRTAVEALFLGLLGFSIPAQAQIPIGLLGGVNDNGAYAAFLQNREGTIVPISGLPTGNGSFIDSVSINSSGDGLVGGSDSDSGYASFVKADGTLIPLDIGISYGQITGVAINKSGLGLVGGVSFSDEPALVAYVTQDGTVSRIDPTQFPIYDSFELVVALNDAGVGLVGAEGGTPIAAYVDPSGNVQGITDTPLYTVTSCAINSSGKGIIGGFAYINQEFSYAAFVSPGKPSIPLVNLPTGNDAGIYGVAINNSGNALVGGSDGNGNAYAAFAENNGRVTPLFSTLFPGYIASVAINDSNVGIIGGQIEGSLFAALTRSNGSIVSLFSEAIEGSIFSVAINEPGVGLIGGYSGSEAYAALVAPNGALTVLDVADPSEIYSVSLQAMNEVVPTFITTYNAPIYSLFAASAALQNRFIWQNRVWQDDCCNPCCLKKESVWLEPFGESIHSVKQQAIPSFKSYLGGFLVGYDRQAEEYIVGIAAGYAFNRVNPEHRIGHVNVNQELISVYGAYYTDYFWIASSLWGGLYQTDNLRTPLSIVKAKSHIYGSLVNPHVEVASPWSLDPCGLTYFEPFASIDFATNWQRHFSERGSSGFNVKMPSVRNSILQAEAGLRFYERFLLGSAGQLCFEEKVSYINQTPYNFKKVNASFVSSSGLFPVVVGSTRVQNLAAFQVLGSYIPKEDCLPIAGFSFQATVGDSYQSYFVGLFGGYDF